MGAVTIVVALCVVMLIGPPQISWKPSGYSLVFFDCNAIASRLSHRSEPHSLRTRPTAMATPRAPMRGWGANS